MLPFVGELDARRTVILPALRCFCAGLAVLG